MNKAKQATFQTKDQKVSGSNPDGCATQFFRVEFNVF